MRDLDLFLVVSLGRAAVTCSTKVQLRLFAWRRSFFSNGENALTQFQDAGTTLAMSQNVQTTPPGIHYAQYDTAKEAEYLPQIRQLISNDLSEPYSIYVYRYFLYQWAELCFMVCYRLPSVRKSASVLTFPRLSTNTMFSLVSLSPSSNLTVADP